MNGNKALADEHSKGKKEPASANKGSEASERERAVEIAAIQKSDTHTTE